MNSRLTNSLTDKSCEQEQQPKGSAESAKVKAWMDSCVLDQRLLHSRQEKVPTCRT